MTNAQKAASVARILSEEKAITFDLASVLQDIKGEAEEGSKSILPAMAVAADIITIGGLIYAISCKIAH